MTILLWGTPLIKPTQALLGHVHSIAYLCRHVVIRLNKLQRGYKVFTSFCWGFFLQAWKLGTYQLLRPGISHAWAITL